MGLLQVAGAVPRFSLRSFQMGTFDDGGFWSLGTIDHLGGSEKPSPLVRQYQALVALPEGLSIFIDRCQALERVEVQRNAALGWRLAADIFNDQQVKLTVAGQDYRFKQHPQQDTWHSWSARSLRIEDALLLQVVAGDGEFLLLQKRQRPTKGHEMFSAGDHRFVEESLVSHELYFGSPVDAPPRTVEPLQWIRDLVALIDCDSPDMSRQPTATIVGSHPCIALELSDLGRTVAVNFADTRQTVESSGGSILVPPLSVRVAP